MTETAMSGTKKQLTVDDAAIDTTRKTRNSGQSFRLQISDQIATNEMARNFGTQLATEYQSGL